MIIHRFTLFLMVIKAIGLGFAILVFSNYSSLVDSQLYLNGYYSNTNQFRTYLVGWLAVILNDHCGPYLAHYTFGIISVLGLVYYYQTGGRRWSLLLTLLLPSALTWTSIVSKESIYYGAFGLAIVVWSSYTIRRLHYHEIFLALVTLLVCFAFRPHYSLSLLWLFVATFLIKNFKDKSPIVMLILFFIGSASIYLWAWDEILWRAYTAIEPTARASRFETYGISPNSLDGFKQFKSQLLLNPLISIIGPLPSEVMNRIEFLPFFIEGAIILIAPLLIYFWANGSRVVRQAALFNKIFWWCIIPAILILIVIHSPFGLLNPGSATRWRTNFEQIFYLAPLLLLYRFIDDDSK